jgi:hypothetical protein
MGLERGDNMNKNVTLGSSEIITRYVPSLALVIVDTVAPHRWEARVALGGASGPAVISVETPTGRNMRPGHRRSEVESLALTAARQCMREMRR